MKFNYYGFKAIYVHEMNRFIRTLGQSLLSPVISTSYSKNNAIINISIQTNILYFTITN